MNTLLLAAGNDAAYQEAGYHWPKNLVEAADEPLIQRVTRSLGEAVTSSGLIVALRKDENQRFHTDSVVRLLVPNAQVIEVKGTTSGAAATALLAAEEIDNDEPLLIANADQVVDVDLAVAIGDFLHRGFDGGIVTFNAVHPRWSYVRLDDEGLVIEAAEKRPISNVATAGLYWFRRGSDFVRGAKTMMRKDASVDGRFFVCPAYNELILEQRRIGTFGIERNRYHSLADPAGMHSYEEHLRTGVLS